MQPLEVQCQELPTQKGFLWNDGLHVRNHNNTYTGKFGGRVMLDLGSFKQQRPLDDLYGTAADQYELRRLRVFHSGQFGNIKYKTSVEFSKEYVFIEDLYLDIVDVPVVGNVRIGHFKEPFLLEMQSSSKHVVFMERGLTTMFSSGRNLGLMLHNRIGQSDLFFQIGAFSNGSFDVVDKTSHIGYNLTGRISGLVAKNENRSKFIHIGLGMKQSWLDLQELKFAARPEAHMAPSYLSSGTMSGIERVTAFSSDVVLQSGSWSFQSEMVHALAYFGGNRKEYSPYHFPAIYGQLSYVVTGENRNYKNGNSGFKKIVPDKSLFAGGWGALEVALRFSYASLESQNIHGGNMYNTTFGLNWYPNSIARLTTNYIISNVVDVGSSDIWQLRFQLAI